MTDKAIDQPITALLKGTAHDARELFRLEVLLAREELHQDLRSVTRAAVAFGVAVVAMTVTVSVLALALVQALGGTIVAALGVAGGFLAAGAVAGGIGVAAFPRTFLHQTQARIDADVERIKEELR